jgi:long-subunit acyl-CoA synthetase (AMP-forming)
MATSLPPFVGLERGGRLISALPMAHVAERMCTHYFPMALALDVTCCPNPREVTAALPIVRPTFFFSPPRLWEKVRASVLAGVTSGTDPTALRVRLGLDQLRGALTGAAPCPPEVIEFVRALGVPLVEGYGLSETSGVATVNPPDRVKVGSVGVPLPGVEVRLAADGEVQIRGDLIMAGYRNLPERTSEAIDSDGWFLTGDVGTVYEDGYYRIVDRKKELIVNAAGKNMSPANIEAKLKMASPLIGQVCVIGDRRPYNVALVTLDPDGASAFATARELADHTPAALVGLPEVRAEIEAGVARANAALSRVEQIKKFALLDVDWEPDSDELTPTMKLRRRAITTKYSGQIEALYA